jgi:hypothetical protein
MYGTLHRDDLYDMFHHLGQRRFVRLYLPAYRKFCFLVVSGRFALRSNFGDQYLGIGLFVSRKANGNGRDRVVGTFVHLPPLRLRRLDSLHDLCRLFFRP